MSWLSDAFSNVAAVSGKAWQYGTSLGGLANNDVSRFFENEIVDKSALRGAQLESIVSGLPVAGDVLRGLEGVSQMEDLYNNTGKVVRYPANQSLGASGIGHGLSDISRKIEGGTHDLYEHYSGDKDDFWTQISNKANWNKPYHIQRTEKLV